MVKDLLHERSAQGQILKLLTKDNIYLVSQFLVNRAQNIERLLVNGVIGSQGLNREDMVLNKTSKLFLAEEVFAKMCYEIAHVRYIKILACLQGSLVIFLY